MPEGGAEGQAADRLARALNGEAVDDPDIRQAVEQLNSVERDDTLVVCAPNPLSPVIAGEMAGGAANVATALFGEKASESLVVLPPAVNTHGLLDVGVMTQGSDNPLEGLAGLLVVREDPTMQIPGADAALQQLDALVVIDNVQHETGKLATTVIAEGRSQASSGTYTQGDFRVQRLEPAVLPEGDAIPLFKALHTLATALGVEVPGTPDEALGVIAKETPAYTPAWDMLVGEGVRMDVAGSGKSTYVAVPERAAASGDGLQVIAARDLYTAADAAAIRHPEAEKLHRYDHFQVSEEDGERLGLENEQELELTDGTRTIKAPVTVTERVPEGAVFVSTMLQGGIISQFLQADGTLPRLRAGVPTPA
ncbi:MAG: hypothetical protein U5Q44_14230 [Dehalococcoidia bacterium]|nr:hypothetical protein [Dehalococcoidia bacterium]